MERQEIFSQNEKILSKKKEKISTASKRAMAISLLRGGAFILLGFLLGSARMLFDSTPLGFALLASCNAQAPFVLIGIVASGFEGSAVSLSVIAGACFLIATRALSSLLLEKKGVLSTEERRSYPLLLESVFSESTSLRVMSSALGVFLVGIWRIIEGGFRFYDLFASIFYLIATPLATFLFSRYFTFQAEKKKQGRAFSITPTSEILIDLSLLTILCAVAYSIRGITFMGISVSLFFVLSVTLYATKKGFVYGLIAGLLLGLSLSPKYAPMLAFCTLAYYPISKLSLFGGAIASCIAGLVFGISSDGISAIAMELPALLTASLTYCTAERLDLFDDVERYFESDVRSMSDISDELLITEQKMSTRNEKLRHISDSFSSLSEIFYDLSSKLKRPSILDLHSICEESFEKHCDGCENRESCFGVEYPQTLDAMKKMAVQLHSHGLADIKKLPDSFKKKCQRKSEIVKDANLSCSVATKKAFQNEKTEIFALDYDAIANILNDAIADNENEFKSDPKMSKKISRVIADAGYGEHSVMVFGKRKLKIIARNLDLNESSEAMSSLVSSIEKIASVKLSEPTFELSFGSVNMQLDAERAFSAECAFSSSTCSGESICGDTVSIFENKNDYLYALISDGMGTGRDAALASETCNIFLRHMLSAGNKIETSLRMLNSVLRSKGSGSENECSATIDLLELDLYSGALTLVKSGAAPTLVLRRSNVFKLASPSFPIGILRSLDAKQLSINCEDGDLIVMVSDGAVKNGDDCGFLNDLLKEDNICDEPASRIADRIVRRARAEAELQSDDISVVVIKVKKEVCSW